MRGRPLLVLAACSTPGLALLVLVACSSPSPASITVDAGPRPQASASASAWNLVQECESYCAAKAETERMHAEVDKLRWQRDELEFEIAVLKAGLDGGR